MTRGSARRCFCSQLQTWSLSDQMFHYLLLKLKLMSGRQFDFLAPSILVNQSKIVGLVNNYWLFNVSKYVIKKDKKLGLGY